MNLGQEHFSDICKIGISRKGEVFKLITKGGQAMVAVRDRAGQWNILSKAGHFGVAQHMAEKLDKDIQWEESLFKSEHNRLLPNVNNEVDMYREKISKQIHNLAKEAKMHSKMHAELKDQRQRFLDSRYAPHLAFQVSQGVPLKQMHPIHQEARKKMLGLLDWFDDRMHQHKNKALAAHNQAIALQQELEGGNVGSIGQKA